MEESALVKLEFKDEEKEIETDFIQSENKEADLFRCHTLTNDMTIAFYREYACLYDNNLTCSHEVDWIDQLSGVNATLCKHSVTANHSSSEV